jgi:urease beta subunit
MTLEQIKKKMQYGDYITLGKMFNIPSTTSKMRFLRGDEKTTEAMSKIIETREKLIDDNRQKLIEEFKESLS